MIGIAGIPGSGKTTLAQIIVKRLNNVAAQKHPSSPSPATFVPMDGFHYPRAVLSAMEDPERAHARRGAAFTFDAPGFRDLVQALREDPNAVTTVVPDGPSRAKSVFAPSFDHAIKDPKENDIEVLPAHRVVVLEGLYIALDKEYWRDAAALMDEIWFVDVDFEVARRRLGERHVRAGIVSTLEEGDRRAMENDLVNGEEIVANKVKIDETVYSREDGAWVHE